ncbi:MAG: type II CAAX endopeptidase family protein [Spirochaetia bacterium]|nr:type II CAAX endopeptidase family protein [Spirochaetia bacterium]
MISEKKEFFFRAVEPFLIYFVLYFPTILQQQIGAGKIDFDNPYLYLTYYAVALPQFLFLLWLIRRQEGVTFSDFGFRKPETPLDILMPVVVLASLFAVQIAAVLLPRMFGWGYPSAQETMPFSITNSIMLLPAFLMFLLTGYTEELYFRSYLLTYLTRHRIPMAAALMISAVLFASGHLYQGWTATASVFVIGLVLGLWFFALKNIHLLAVSHTLFNFFQLLFIYFTNTAVFSN